MHSRPTSTARPARARSTRCRLLRRSSVSRIVSSGSQPAAAGRPKGSRSRWRRADSGACPRLDCRGVETPKAIDAMAYPGKRTCSLLQMASPATFRAYAPRKLMMKCPRCQHENQTAANFCEECAVPLARTCPSCGSRAAATAEVLPRMWPLSNSTRGRSTLRLTPELHTPRTSHEKILTSREALEGERKQVTVLFADVKGSMELLARDRRSRGGAQAPRSGDRAHDGGRPSL